MKEKNKTHCAEEHCWRELQGIRTWWGPKVLLNPVVDYWGEDSFDQVEMCVYCRETRTVRHEKYTCDCGSSKRIERIYVLGENEEIKEKIRSLNEEEKVKLLHILKYCVHRRTMHSKDQAGDLKFMRKFIADLEISQEPQS